MLTVDFQSVAIWSEWEKLDEGWGGCKDERRPGQSSDQIDEEIWPNDWRLFWQKHTVLFH